MHKKSKVGLIWDLGGSFTRQFVTFFISIVLARLLSPAEFGTIAMAMVFVSITQVFIDVGFTQGLIQKQDTKDITYSSIFYINLLISLFFSGLIVLAAPFIGDFYDQEKVTNLLFLLAVIPPIAALGKVHSAILMKRLDLRSLNIRDVLATMLGGAVGVTAAYLDFGVYSLAFQQITTVCMSTLLLWFSSKWKPKLEYSNDEVKGLLGFSSFVFFDDLMRQIFNRIEIVFIGKMFSPTILGFYTRAESFSTQIKSYSTESLRKVMFPLFSALQHDENKINTTYLRVFKLASSLNFFLVGGIYFISKEVIVGLMGVKWYQSVVFFKILIFIALISPQVGLMDKLILAKGFAKVKFKMGVFQRFLKIVPLLIGYFYGIFYFSVSFTISAYIVFFAYMWLIYNKLNISILDQLKSFFTPSILLLVRIVAFEFLKPPYSGWYFAIAFTIINFIYLKMIRNEGYYFLLGLLNKGKAVLFRKRSAT